MSGTSVTGSGIRRRGELVTLGNGEKLTVQRVSMYGATLTPRRWWHRSRLLRWIFVR